MSRFWSEQVHRLEPYVPGEQPQIENLVKLNTNENPYPPSPRVVRAIQDALSEQGALLRLYPDPSATLLNQAIADYYQLPLDHVFSGNGSDEVLAHIFMGLLRQSQPILFPDITYSFYKVYCGLYGIDYQLQPLQDDFSIDLAGFPEKNGGIIFANPNAPTGLLLPLNSIEALLKRNKDSVVVVDEAYVDFGGESAAALVPAYDNLVVVQTLSKSRSLAGLRIGFALAQPHLIEALERIKNSFNSYPMDRLATVAGKAALDDKDYFERTCQQVIDSRERLQRALVDLGFSVLPSAANFLFAKHNRLSGQAIAAGLRQQSVIVRHFSSPARIADFVRITVGNEQQNQRLLDALKQHVLESVSQD